MNREALKKVHIAIPRLVEELEGGKLSRREFLRTTTLLGLSATTAYALAGKITGEHLVEPAMAQEPKMGGELRIGMSVLDITDPAVYDWSEKGNIARQIIEPLARVGTDNVTRPHLAERWEASDDVSQWTFYLRKGVKWNNGDDFNADDVIATFERWLDPATGSSNQGRFSALTVTEGDTTKMAPGALERVDDHTVRFNLQRPMLAFPESLGDYPALITHRDFATKMGANLIENPVGTGPFLLESFSVGEGAVLKKRPAEEYWGDEVYLDGLRYVDLGSDPSAQLAGLASNQVDLLYTLDIALLPAVQNMPTVKTYEKVTAITGVARMHVDLEPYSDKRVRQAIQACIDHERLLQLAYQNLGVPGEDFHVSPIHPEYTPLPPLKQDYEKAKALLAEAGHGDGLEIEIVCVNDPKWESNIAQVIAQMVAPAGITLKVNVLPGGTYWDRWTTWPFSITQWTSRPLGVQVLALGYKSGVAWNETAYANPEFDKLLSEAEATLDIEKRKEIVHKLEQILQEDVPAIIPFWTKIYTASNDRVNGFEYHIAREQHLEKVWLA